ncbi:MAG: Gfo/Idh/MocA family oxidoreductase [Thermoguttaceae bacterium]|nr:Gfo/Idh/MocA family oxidoreductase [Thermoguttaceae bacterium]
MIRRSFMKTSLGMGTAALLGGALKADEPKPEAANDEPFKKIKIAQIGVRHEHASGKMNTLKMLPQYYEIVGIAAENPEEEQRHKNDGVYKNLNWMSQEELLNIPGLEAVAVETEMTELLPTAMKCAARGLHMHVDKPLGQDLNELKTLLDLCREKNVLIQPGYMYRTNQAFRLLLHAYRSGWLGELHDIQLDMCRNDTSEGFRKWLATYRGGGLYDFGSHLVDFVVELLGAPDEIHVFEKPDPKDGLNDNTLSVLLYEKAIAEIRVSLRKIDGFARRRLAAHGTKGSFVLDPLENWSRDTSGKMVPLNVTLTLDQDQGEYHKGVNALKLEPYTDRYIGQLTEFAHYVRGLKENPYSYDFELLSQKVILAASGYTKWEK